MKNLSTLILPHLRRFGYNYIFYNKFTANICNLKKYFDCVRNMLTKDNSQWLLKI